MAYSANEQRYQQMQYRRCGKSGIQLSALSLGLWHNFGDVDDEAVYRKTLHTAFDCGITHFDLANNYGPPPGSAEINFGKILKEDFAAYRDELIISSKAGYYMWPGPYGEWGSKKNLVASLNQSLQRMQLDYLDLYYCHRPDKNTPIEEVVLTYPGFMAVTAYRIAHVLCRLQVPLMPRMISEWAHSITGIDIHPGATIGVPFMIDHGTGVVIGETSIIGKNVKIYQGVTIGALAVKKEEAEVKRHPTIEDNVIVYANSTILGGKTIIGRDSIIGGNCFVTESVPAQSMVYHQPIITVKNKKDFTEPLNWVI